jgi:hypothetical protein
MEPSARKVATVDTGFASPEKRSGNRFDNNQQSPESRARTSDGPGVFMSGDPTPPTNPRAQHAPAVRLGNPSPAVPL